MTDPKSIPPNGVSVREFYKLLDERFDKLSEELRQRDQQTWARIIQMKSDADAVHAKHEEAIEKLSTEIYGEGENRGLRVRMTDLERNTKAAHGIQAVLTLVGASIAAALGMKR